MSTSGSFANVDAAMLKSVMPISMKIPDAIALAKAYTGAIKDLQRAHPSTRFIADDLAAHRGRMLKLSCACVSTSRGYFTDFRCTCRRPVAVQALRQPLALTQPPHSQRLAQAQRQRTFRQSATCRPVAGMRVRSGCAAAGWENLGEELVVLIELRLLSQIG